MTLLTADDVLNVKFQVSSFKEGYNQDEVDEFLDEVTTTMREFEERLGTSQASSGPLAPEGRDPPDLRGRQEYPVLDHPVVGVSHRPG